MTDEELKYHIALQGVYREKMGEWPINGDQYNYQNKTFYFGGELPEFDNTERKLIRIPRPIDTENPERGLWGMIDWNKFYIRSHKDGDIQIMKYGEVGFNKWFVIAPVTLSLLKALAAQEGIEV